MPDKGLTQRLVKEIKKHGENALEQLDAALKSKQIGWKEIDFTAALESDFGPDMKGKVMRMGDDAIEAIITSGTFNKMIPRVIRTALAENPKEQYKMSAVVPVETKGECEDSTEDHGVFSDPEVQEIGELEKPPLFGVATDYMKHPKGRMSGLSLAFTREALCRDPNSFIQKQVPKIADAHNQYKENKILDTFIGYLHTFNRSGTAYSTYYAASGTSFPSGGPWVNAAYNNFLCSNDLQSVRNMFYDHRDMVHGRPIEIDTDNLTLLTSKQNADRIRPLLLASAIENDETCSGGETRKYIMTAEVANGMTFDLMSYQRFVDRIKLRYGVSASTAQQWWWAGRIPEFISWVSQISPTVTRCPLGAEECQRRVVALYTSVSKGYAYITNQYAGVMLEPD